MYNLTTQEIEVIDNQLDSKLTWAKDNQALAEQLAMDATKLLSCTEDRVTDYEGKGFFIRCWSSFSGKTAQMQRDNQNDLISMQKTAWRYLQLLNERDILMAHSLITIKNNLETLAIKEEETRNEITRFAIKVSERFKELNKRVDNIEIDVNVLQWLTTIKVQDYDEKYPYYIRLLVLIYDFQNNKSDNWNAKDIQSLQQAILDAKIERKDKTTIDNFVSNILDEIEHFSFEMFERLAKCLISNININPNDITEEISSPIFTSIFLIVDNYTKSDEIISIMEKEIKTTEKSNSSEKNEKKIFKIFFNKNVNNDIKENSFSKKDMMKKIILSTIEKAGVDTKKELTFQDIALEILSCSRLIRLLKLPIIQNHIEQKEEIEIQNNQIEVQYDNNINSEIIQNFISVEKDFLVCIKEDNRVYTLGKNNYGCLGIGNTDTSFNSKNKFIAVKELPDIDVKSISVYDNSVLILLDNNEVYAWGKNNSFGAGHLGVETTDDKYTPYKVKGLPIDKKVIKIILGANSSYILLENGELYCAGRINNSSIFLKFELSFRVKNIEVLYDDNGLVFIDVDDNIIVYRTGSYTNWAGEYNSFFYPKGIPDDETAKNIFVGANYFFVQTNNNRLYSIGDNSKGQMGIDNYGNSEKIFKRIYGIEEEIIDIFCSKEQCDREVYTWQQPFVLALTKKYLYGWGANDEGQIGQKVNYKTKYDSSGVLMFKKTYARNYYFETKPRIISIHNMEIDSLRDIIKFCVKEKSLTLFFKVFEIQNLSQNYILPKDSGYNFRSLNMYVYEDISY